MRVLSLFDGISCGMVALERAGIDVEEYFAYEIDKNAIFISEKNYPNIKHCGDVTSEDFTKYKGKIDILIGGSPCQNLSVAGNRKGLDGEASGLFYDFVRALYESNPKWFLLENNASMTKANRDIISAILGVEPILINSNLVSAQDRKRLYWTNIPNITQPQDRGIFLKDIVQPKREKQNYAIYERMLAKREGTLAYKKAWDNVRTLEQKSKTLTTSQGISNSGATNIKYSDDEYYLPTPLESERLQTLPDGYTEGVSNTQRYKAIGNGWTVDVIAHIFSYLQMAIDNNIKPIKVNRIERPEQSYRQLENNTIHNTDGKEVRVLSLFDGIACGRVALERAGIGVKRYDAYEVDKNAIKVATSNYPDISEKGNVFDAVYDNRYDLLIGGSPCTYWSVAKTNGERETKPSGIGFDLFMQYVRALQEAKPKYFLYENNASISSTIKDEISKYLGVKPITINSALVSAQNRNRCYWTNIPFEIPEDRNICLSDVVKFPAHTFKPVGEWVYSYWSGKQKIDGLKTINSKKSHCLTTSKTHPMGYYLNYDKTKYCNLTVNDYELLQTLPLDYVDKIDISESSKYKAIGNGWTVEVIAHILKGIR